ncbi:MULTISPECIES: hypothetical protein [unclassified Mesorhizobium]|uniref:hypothetical protein n=1 Tax=unclassified Mesorhizobium TaxID=325217 RepID=UPI000FCAFC08|nr:MULTISPECIES: hypothetical protein [unclassified Mesorhizobium]RUW23233.1 hypothetical protein EOA34_18905 [Mesorhizobium sp. M4B.F.Ca.ET.013.02.1.1]RUW68053.1 hypothetical protein EOA31_27030 [Mesorhizobium sp. M4B.F.Ca.ET.049.02.1.2]RVD31652.1 hypothetical protein EN738_01135 [Mesorhizobium sp. M4B.F.Ca.ET.017.02.2.1]RWF62632.1 MAG: hypothetical protein EOS47_22685 [Mesorhizobium sp.]TGQ10748.1 hypothetical protein EN858_16920 [Mesorhizobium sp. M4B.F.Ca.ET.215.01.1.1]
MSVWRYMAETGGNYQCGAVEAAAKTSRLGDDEDAAADYGKDAEPATTKRSGLAHDEDDAAGYGKDAEPK